jgi:hypothetical protein
MVLSIVFSIVNITINKLELRLKNKANRVYMK